MRAAIVAMRDPGIGAVQRRRRHEPEQESPGVAPDREVAVLAVEPAEDVAVALQEHRTDAEELDLLGVVFAREHRLEVVLHARLRRAPEEQAEGDAGEARLGDESGQAREHQHGDGPGREVGEQGAVAHQRYRVLRKAEGAHDERQRAARSLAPRTRQLVVELGVLEVGELERQRLLEDHRVDALAELGAEQRLAERDAALRARERGDAKSLGPHQQQRMRSEGVAFRRRRLDRRDHGVHDQRADPGDRGGQHAAEQRQHAERDAERAIRGPDELERMAAVAEHAEEAACEVRRRGRQRTLQGSSSGNTLSGGRPIAAKLPATTIGRSIRTGSSIIAAIHWSSLNVFPAYFAL